MKSPIPFALGNPNLTQRDIDLNVSLGASDSFTESAGESFKRFGLDVLGQFKNIALGALRTSLFGSGGKGGGIAGSLFGSLVNGLFNAATKQANGGVMTGGGPLALRRYAAGGVA